MGGLGFKRYSERLIAAMTWSLMYSLVMIVDWN